MVMRFEVSNSLDAYGRAIFKHSVSAIDVMLSALAVLEALGSSLGRHLCPSALSSPPSEVALEDSLRR
eukprot:COSAG02_NODE_19470_length_880_cov_0.856594_2_plen_67_part_01